VNPTRLGRVTLPSGALLVLDESLAGLWVHDAPGPGPDDEPGEAGGLVDLCLTGKDAEAAGRSFDRDWDPVRIHDVPREGADELAAAFVAHAARQGLDAGARLEPAVEPFHARLAKALGRGAGGISFAGNWAAAAGGLPARDVELVAEPMDDGPDGGRWKRVVLDFAPGIPGAHSDEVARVTCDSGRLLVADPAAIRRWQHVESLDGRGDCVFWGRDARVAADELNAVGLESRAWGWVNLPVDEALRLAQRVEGERRERGLALSVDFRPHSHHLRMMERIRESPCGAGELELDGAAVLAFDVTWGEGTYAVVRDLDADGRTLRLAIELARDHVPTVH
jgi:hypothetical protein